MGRLGSLTWRELSVEEEMKSKFKPVILCFKNLFILTSYSSGKCWIMEWKGSLWITVLHSFLCETLRPHPPTSSLSSNHVFFLAGRWSTSGWGGNAHFFTYTLEYDRGRQEKIERQTNKHEQTWSYQEQREVCNTTCMCIPNSRYMDYR